MATLSLLARLAVLRVEAAAVAAVLGERDLLPEHAHELIHGGRVRAVHGACSYNKTALSR